MSELQKTLERGTETCGKVHDLVERIRFHIGIRGGPTKDDDGNYVGTTWPMMLEAASEIERLSYQLVQAKQRLDHIASLTDERGEIGSLARAPLTVETKP